MNIPPTDSDFCIENQIYRPHRKSQAIYIVTVCGLFICLLALPFIKVDIVIRGAGVVRPILEKTEILAPQSECIKDIRAKDGALLEQGDTILVLNSSSIAMSIRAQKVLELNLTGQISDLEQMIQGKKPTPFQSEKRRSEYLLYRQKEEEALSQEKAAQQKIERNQPLFSLGVIPKDEFEDIALRKEQATLALKTLKENQRTTWESDLNEMIQQAREAQTKRQQLEREIDLHCVVAPVRGYLEGFIGWHKGMYISSGQTLGSISPESTIQVENYIQPKDIGFLHLGMKVKMASESFNYSEWGNIHGTITEISSDFQLHNNTAYYLVKCVLDKPYFQQKDGRKGYLKKGMNMRSLFKINRCSLLQLMYQKMNDWANPYQLSKMQSEG